MISKFAWLQNQSIKKIVSALNTGGNTTFNFVGGCIRDSILGLEPKDFDIASILSATENIKLLSHNGIKAIPLAVEYGTILAIIDSFKFEITTLRKDVISYGRKADVSFVTSYKEDAKRRDFSINALYLNPCTNKITDYFNGITDLKQGKINFIGNPKDRISEDYLRILRFIRFYTYFGKILPALQIQQVIISNVSKLLLLSKERISEEFYKILHHKNVTKGIRLLNKLNISYVLFKQHKLHFLRLSNLNNLAKFYNINVINIVKLLALVDNPSNIKLHLQLNKIDLNFLKTYNKLNKEFAKNFKSSYFLARYNKHILENYLLLLASKSKKVNLKYSYLINIMEELQSLNLSNFNITGHDIIKLNVPSNKIIGKVLTKLKEWAIDNNSYSKTILVQKAKDIIKDL